MSDTVRLVTRQRAKGKYDPTADLNTEALLALARERAPNPAVFDRVNPAFWRVQASNNSVDFYATIMDPATLDNFALALDAGVSYQDSHDFRKNGWGQSLASTRSTHAEKVPETGEALESVEGTFFTLLDQSLNGQDTTHFINMIEAGAWRDVSVGFYASDIRCTICGKQSLEKWWDLEEGCQHIPGFEYALDGGKKTVTAYARIMDGQLVEVSQVYDGATPGAAVLKAQLLAEDGQLTGDQARMIHDRYQVRIAVPTRSYPAIGGRDTAGKPAKETRMGQDQDGGLTAEQTQLAAIRTKLGLAADGDIEAAIATLTTERDAATAEQERLAPLAAIGETYRATLVTDLHKAGVRAYGDDYDRERYDRLVEKLDVEDLETMKLELDARGDSRLKGGTANVGGRRTVDTTEGGGDGKETPEPGDGDELARQRRRRRRRSA